MSDKKLGEVYFRDHHGNFHKLSTSDFNKELNELSTFDSIAKSDSFKTLSCNYKPYYYNLILLENVNKCSVVENKLHLDKGLYRFNIYLNVTSCEDQTIYFFLRNNKVIPESLQVKEICKNIPNNLNFSFILCLNCPEVFEVALLSEKSIEKIKSYLLFMKLD